MISDFIRKLGPDLESLAYQAIEHTVLNHDFLVPLQIGQQLKLLLRLNLKKDKLMKPNDVKHVRNLTQIHLFAYAYF